MASLVLGPLQRFADETRATVWVETDQTCDVTVLGQTTPTFAVHGHHYALVQLDGLEPDARQPYDVRLDGVRVWPPEGYDLPDPVIRTRGHGGARVTFGSCRGAAPLEPPWTLDKREDDRGLGPDALAAYASRMIAVGEDQWPDLVLLLGDQVYADDASPETRAYIRRTRDTSAPPGEEMANFEEYTRLYHESWSAPLIRWLLSTVPVAMIFDDHDIIDDWNISQRWLADIRATDWWDDRIVGGFVAYWIYQHLGNLSPDDLAGDDLLRRVRETADAGDLLDEFARTADRHPDTVRWSFHRHLGDTHVVVVDSRAARVLDEGARDMLDEAEWRWLADRLAEPCRRLLVGSSLPVLMPHSIHDVERWNQRLASGVWGRWVAELAERTRRAFDLEHWAAFPRSFERLISLLTDVASRNDAPDAVTLLSGDIHHGYVARLEVDTATPVHQVVASPMRQNVEPLVMRGYRIGVGPLGRWLGRVCTRVADLGRPHVGWRRISEALFANHVATIDTGDDGVLLRMETAHQVQPAGPGELRPAVTMRLAHARRPARR